VPAGSLLTVPVALPSMVLQLQCNGPMVIVFRLQTSGTCNEEPLAIIRIFEDYVTLITNLHT
jgi:hypothetical protein